MATVSDTAPTHFADRLAAVIGRRGNPVVVGLDPRPAQLPSAIAAPPTDLPQLASAYVRFCSGVIEAIAPLVGSIKLQAACFEQLGPAGMQALGQVIRYGQAAGLLVILDGKRNDIGSTAAAYADGLLGRESAWGADALTVNPYLGDDSLEPFVRVAKDRGAGVFVLVKTSNPGGRMFQDLLADGAPLYRHVADYVERLAEETAGACGYGLVGAVAGATYPEQLAQLRDSMPHTWFLIPGFGSQGGTAADVAPAFDSRGLGAVINNSRGIIFAHARAEYAHFGAARWQEAVAAATRDMIAQLAAAGIRPTSTLGPPG